MGVGDILIHVCISACEVLYIRRMNLRLPSRQTSEESHGGAEHKYEPIILHLMYAAIHWKAFNSLFHLFRTQPSVRDYMSPNAARSIWMQTSVNQWSLWEHMKLLNQLPLFYTSACYGNKLQFILARG